MSPDGGAVALARAIEHVVSSSPPSFVASLVRALRSADAAGAPERLQLGAIVAPGDLVRARLFAAWREAPSFDARALALALEAASASRVAASSTVELVWTGPATDAASTLNTTAVVFRIVRRARSRLVLMSFSAYPIAGLLDELRAACERGVGVRLILESALESGGRLTVDASKPFESLRDRARFYVWPHERRSTGASMHAKVAVADGTFALVTSANLTERGLDANLELGTYFEGGDIPAEIERRLDDLIARGTLERVA